jgi:hypothetical protein
MGKKKSRNPDGGSFAQQRFVDALLDPSLVPGIYQYCDQWCTYCPSTARCLAYRCRQDVPPPGAGPASHESFAESVQKSLEFMKQLTVAEGRLIPEVDILLSNDPERMRAIDVVDDALELMGRRYAITSSRYLVSRPDFPFAMVRRPEGPLPFEVFAWYHMLIAAKIYRAIVSSLAAARGDSDRLADALASAKTALVGIDRSRDAISAMRAEDDDARLEHMDAQLRRLKREVEGRFPDARLYVRRGLDECQ